MSQCPITISELQVGYACYDGHTLSSCNVHTSEESTEHFANDSSEYASESFEDNSCEARDNSSSSNHFANESSDHSDWVAESETHGKTLLPSKLFTQPPQSLDHQTRSSPIEQICSKNCMESCSTFFHNMNDDEKKELLDLFQDSKKSNIKRKLLDHLKSQKALGLDLSNFQFHSHTFCVPAFCHATGISSYLAIKVLRDFALGTNQYEHGSCGVSRASHAHVNFISWMISFADLHGQSDPVKITTVLPAFLNKAELFKIYKTEASLPHVKCSTFYYLMKKCFGVNRSDKSLPNIRISKYSTHSKADHLNKLIDIRGAVTIKKTKK